MWIFFSRSKCNERWMEENAKSRKPSINRYHHPGRGLGRERKQSTCGLIVRNERKKSHPLPLEIPQIGMHREQKTLVFRLCFEDGASLFEQRRIPADTRLH